MILPLHLPLLIFLFLICSIKLKCKCMDCRFSTVFSCSSSSIIFAESDMIASSTACADTLAILQRFLNNVLASTSSSSLRGVTPLLIACSNRFFNFQLDHISFRSMLPSSSRSYVLVISLIVS